MAAQMAPTQPFMWGQGGAMVTPDSIARNRKVLDALRQQAGHVPRGWWSLVGDLAGEGVAAGGEANLNKQEGDAQAGAMTKVQEALKNREADVGALLTDPWVANSPGGSAVASALFGRQMQQSDPAYQLDLKLKQAQLAKATAPAAVDPTANLRVINDKVVNIATGKVMGDYGDPAGAGGGVYDGTSMDAQNWNILLTGDPASPAYAAAYSQLTQPRTTFQMTEQGMVPVQTTPSLPPSVRPPAYMGTPDTAAPAPSGASAPPPAGGVSVGTALPGTEKPLTEGQSKDVVFVTRGTGANEILRALDTKLTSLIDNAAGKVPLGGYAQSEDYQKADNAGREFLAAILRKDSGGAITGDEMNTYGGTYLPQPGDKPGVIAQKAAARERALKAMTLGLPPAAILSLEQAGVLSSNEPPLVTPQTAVPPPVAPPAVGAVIDGYRFKGGDPADPNSWEKV